MTQTWPQCDGGSCDNNSFRGWTFDPREPSRVLRLINHEESLFPLWVAGTSDSHVPRSLPIRQYGGALSAIRDFEANTQEPELRQKEGE